MPRWWPPSCWGSPTSTSIRATPAAPTCRPGATIAESRTSVPVSTDQLLKQLQRTLQALNPHAVGDLVTNLAQDLDGQGARPEPSDQVGGGNDSSCWPTRGSTWDS